MTFPINSIQRFTLAALATACITSWLTAAEPDKKKVSDPERWENTIQKFEAADAVTPPPRGAVLLIGGSNARRWRDVDDYFPDRQVINRGFGGAQLYEILHYLDRIVLPYAPKVIVINAGGNDLSSGKTPKQVREIARLFVAKVHAALPDTRIYYLGLPHVTRASQNPELLAILRGMNEQLSELARTEKSFEFIDLYSAFTTDEGKPRPELYVEDGIHFRPEAYEIIADLLRGKI